MTVSREEVVTTRDVDAIAIPAGNRILIPEGVSVTITQSLGGAFTVITPQGYLARIAGSDGDALGKERLEAAPAPPADHGEDAEGLEKQVWDQLRTVYDPEIPVNVVDLGLIYGCRLLPAEGGTRVEIDMTMTAPGCGMGDVLRVDAEDKIRALSGVVDCFVEIVWEPPWDQSRMSEAAKLELGFG